MEPSRRTLLKAAGIGGGLALAGGGSADGANAQPGGLKACSGLLRVTDHARRGDAAYRAVVPFGDFPSDGELLPPEGYAEMRAPRQVGGVGPFDGSPAYVTHIREYQVEDRAGVGSGEIDVWTINSIADPGGLVVDWGTDEGDSFVKEIGVLAIGL